MGWKALFWCPCHLAGKSGELFFEKLTEMMGEAILLQMASQMQNASGAAAPWAEEKEKGQEKGQEKGKEKGKEKVKEEEEEDTEEEANATEAEEKGKGKGGDTGATAMPANSTGWQSWESWPNAWPGQGGDGGGDQGETSLWAWKTFGCHYQTLLFSKTNILYHTKCTS